MKVEYNWWKEAVDCRKKVMKKKSVYRGKARERKKGHRLHDTERYQASKDSLIWLGQASKARKQASKRDLSQRVCRTRTLALSFPFVSFPSDAAAASAQQHHIYEIKSMN